MSIDGSFLYLEGLTATDIEPYIDREPTARELSPIHNALRALHDRVDEKLSDYIAILSMDGDDMGTLAEHFFDEGDHTTLSETLTNFGH